MRVQVGIEGRRRHTAGADRKEDPFRRPGTMFQVIRVCVAVALAVGMTSLTPSAFADDYTAQAGPNVFGPWTQVGATTYSRNFVITATPVGNTSIVGEVMYFKGDVNKEPDVEPFFGRTVIKTGSGLSTVKVRFKGRPFGSTVAVHVD
jgi:hypothetical protein